MSLLPDVIDGDGMSPRQLSQAVGVQRRTELQVFQHSVRARYQAEIDRIDSQAAGDALRAALDEETDLLDYGLRLANGSASKAELVARKVELLSSTNNRRFSRRFGG